MMAMPNATLDRNRRRPHTPRPKKSISAIPAMSEQVRSTADFQEGITSFVERRAARFSGR